MDTNRQTDEIGGATEPERKVPVSKKRLFVFLVCLVISILMWLFIELMKDYNEEVGYGVVFENVPANLILTNGNDSIIKVGINAQGFEFLAAKYLQRNRKLKIDLSSLKIRQTEDGFTAYMPSQSVIDQLGNQLRFIKSFTYIKPDTLFFRFSKVFKKEVPVMPDFSYTLGSQYDVFDSVDYFPKTVVVSSIKSVLDTLRFVKTRKMRWNALDSVFLKKVPLSKGPSANLIKYSVDSITVKINVQQVTEAVYTVPISLESNGASVKIFPDKVDILCRVPLSEFPNINATSFSAQVVYDKIAVKEKKLEVTLTNFPKMVRVLKIKPSEVEFIIISK